MSYNLKFKLMLALEIEKFKANGKEPYNVFISPKTHKNILNDKSLIIIDSDNKILNLVLNVSIYIPDELVILAVDLNKHYDIAANSYSDPQYLIDKYTSL